MLAEIGKIAHRRDGLELAQRDINIFVLQEDERSGQAHGIPIWVVGEFRRLVELRVMPGKNLAQTPNKRDAIPLTHTAWRKDSWTASRIRRVS